MDLKKPLQNDIFIDVIQTSYNISLSLMSIYSGFPTRRDQEKYNGLLSKLILTLQNHIIELAGDAIPHSKIVSYSRIISRMKDYEEHKYLPPKFSELLDPLSKLMGLSTACEQRINPNQYESEDGNIMQDKAKQSSLSLNKFKLKPRYGLGEISINQKLKASEPNIETYHFNLQPNIKKNHFDSRGELKQRKIFSNNLPPKDLQRSKNNEAIPYDNSFEATQKWNSISHTKATKPSLANHVKSNLRSKAFQGFNDSQDQSLRKDKFSREQKARERLKTEGGNRSNDL